MTRKYYKNNSDIYVDNITMTFVCSNTKEEITIETDHTEINRFTGYYDCGEYVSYWLEKCPSCGKSHEIIIKD